MATQTISFRKPVALGILTALLCGVAGAALAGTDTANLAVSATVAANCTISAGTGISFGSYDPIVTNASTALDGTGTITTTCTNGASANVTLGQGSNADTGSTDAAPLRRMTDGTDMLSYQLYTDNGHTTVWDNSTGVDVTGTGTASDTTVYGEVAGGQNVGTGTYTDTVVATVTF